MDLRKLKTVLELFEDAKHISELEIGDGEEKIRLRKNSAPPPPQPAPPVPQPATPAAISETPAPIAAPVSDSTVVAPMVGTFYRAASPEMPPFVRIGQTVEVGQTLCIIEAMKLMNEIASTKTGKVRDILVENGAAVGYGTALFVIE